MALHSPRQHQLPGEDDQTIDSILDRESLLPESGSRSRLQREEAYMDSHTISDPQKHTLRGKPRKLWVFQSKAQLTDV
jgi:hypothetical protein